MATSPSKEAPKEEQKAVEQPAVVEGEKANLRAVFGEIIHPFTAQKFDTGSNVTVTVDNWTLVQFQHGKLALAE